MTTHEDQKQPTPVVAETFAASVPAWQPRPGHGRRPDVLVVVLDDLGYGQLSCYGSTIRTPHIDSLAEQGLRYSNFHVTTLCSPTRASLLTGRNHHSVGMGFLAGFDTGFDAYRGHVSASAATIARVLEGEGYGTYAVGKWHLTPAADMTPSGPFEHWPLRHGFNRYYGFLWGQDDHFAPQLWEDNHAIDPPRRPGYHLTDDLADRACSYLDEHLSTAPDRPFFLYLALGAAHTPHQAPRAEIDAYRGQFDHGWDEERRRVLERQISLGVVPPGTALPPSDPDVPRWDDLDDDERRLYARMNEVFAGFVTHADRAVGRVLETLREWGRLDDTVVVVLSDNGASGQGGEHGSINEYRHLVGLPDSFEDNLAAIDELGGPATHNHYPTGWAQAGNTPLRYYKTYTFGGGVRAPLIVHWPAGIARRGEVREQFHHVIDIVPTLLDVCGVTPQHSYDGVEQLPMHGTSMRYTFDEPEAPGHRRVQYFEMAGHRGIWCDGWKAVTNHRTDDDYRTESWELFDLTADFSEARDLSAEHPEMVARLDDLWWQEASAYQVLPLDDRFQKRATQLAPGASRLRFHLARGIRVFSPVAGPNFADRSFRISADLVRRSADEEGVVLGYGRKAAGFALFVQDGHLVLDYNRAGAHLVLRSTRRLGTGPCRVELRMTRVAAGSATAQLVIDGDVDTEAEVATLLGGFGGLSTQVGHNAPSGISPLFEPPFALPGLRYVDIEFDEPDVAPSVDTEIRHQ